MWTKFILKMRTILTYCMVLLMPFLFTKKEVINESEKIDAEYCNTRFDFCLKYPSGILSNQQKSDNGDGIIFTNETETMMVNVSGVRAVFPEESFERHIENIKNSLSTKNGDELRYVITKKELGEISYVKGDKLYYQKFFHQLDKQIVLEIVVPKDKIYGMKKIKNKLKIKIG